MYNEDQKIAFLFSPELNTEFLQDLYGDDLQQAAMVFESTIQQLRGDRQLAESKFNEGDLQSLKKVIHKMKPLLGYIGLNEYMEEFADFEKICLESEQTSYAEEGFRHIRSITDDAIKIAEKEFLRLKQHNTQYL